MPNDSMKFMSISSNWAYLTRPWFCIYTLGRDILNSYRRKFGGLVGLALAPIRRC
jgi:hypothetical protein